MSNGKANSKGGEVTTTNALAVGPQRGCYSVTPGVDPCVVALGKLTTPELKTYVKDHMAQGRTVVYELVIALRELKSRCKTEKIWHKTLLECGIKPGTWRQWEFRELNQLTTGKRTGSRKKPVPAQATTPVVYESPKELLTKRLKEIQTILEKGSSPADANPLRDGERRVSSALTLVESTQLAIDDGLLDNIANPPQSGGESTDLARPTVLTGDEEPIPLATLADRLLFVADELGCAWGLEEFACGIEAIAERMQDRDVLNERMLTLEKRMAKSPTHSVSGRYLFKELRRDRRFQSDMKLIQQAGGTTYRGQKILGGDDPYIWRFTRAEIKAELNGKLANQLGVCRKDPGEETRDVLSPVVENEESVPEPPIQDVNEDRDRDSDDESNDEVQDGEDQDQDESDSPDCDAQARAGLAAAHAAVSPARESHVKLPAGQVFTPHNYCPPESPEPSPAPAVSLPDAEKSTFRGGFTAASLKRVDAGDRVLAPDHFSAVY